MKILIEDYDYKKHYVRFAPLLVRYYREINQEDLETEIPIFSDGKWLGVKRLDCILHGLLGEGTFSKVAILDEEIVGFLWYKQFHYAMVVMVEAFYVKKDLRSKEVGKELMNSFCNEYNQGRFEVYGTFHEKNRPEEMLKAFHQWEILRPTNDRDLILFRGVWDKNLIQKEVENAVIREAKITAISNE